MNIAFEVLKSQITNEISIKNNTYEYWMNIIDVWNGKYINDDEAKELKELVEKYYNKTETN